MDRYDDTALPVLVPYKVLVKLLEYPKEVEQLRKEVAHQNRQLGALRGQLFEVIEKIRNK